MKGVCVAGETVTAADCSDLPTQISFEDQNCW